MNHKRIIAISVMAAIAVVVLDAVSTMMAIQQPNTHEINILMLWLTQYVSFAYALAMLTIAKCFLFCGLGYSAFRVKTFNIHGVSSITWLMLTTTAFMVPVVMNNFWIAFNGAGLLQWQL